MAKKQPELPGTRRPDEAELRSIPALDDKCAELEKRKGKVTKETQGVVATKHEIDQLLHQHGLTEYLFESAGGVEKKVFLTESVRTAKVKRARDADDADAGDDV